MPIQKDDSRYIPGTGEAHRDDPVGKVIQQRALNQHFWEEMEGRTIPVIVVCSFCGSHNAISSPSCVRCGAPAGWSKHLKGLYLVNK